MAAKTDNRALQGAAEVRRLKDGAPPVPTVMPAYETPEEQPPRRPEGVHRTPASRPPRAGGVQTPQEKAAAIPMSAPAGGAPPVPTMMPAMPQPTTAQPALGAPLPSVGSDFAPIAYGGGPQGDEGGEAPAGGLPSMMPGNIPKGLMAAKEALDKGIPYATELSDPAQALLTAKEVFDKGIPGTQAPANPYDVNNPDQTTQYWLTEAGLTDDKYNKEAQAEVDAITNSIKLDTAIAQKKVQDQIASMGGGGERTSAFDLGILTAKGNAAIAEADVATRSKYRQMAFDEKQTYLNAAIQAAQQRNDLAGAERLTKMLESMTTTSELMNLAETKPDGFIAMLGASDWDPVSKKMIEDANKQAFEDYYACEAEHPDSADGTCEVELRKQLQDTYGTGAGIQVIKTGDNPNDPYNQSSMAFYGMPPFGSSWEDWSPEQRNRLVELFNKGTWGNPAKSGGWAPASFAEALQAWGIPDYDQSEDEKLAKGYAGVGDEAIY